jgi:hypothetical protein
MLALAFKCSVDPLVNNPPNTSRSQKPKSEPAAAPVQRTLRARFKLSRLSHVVVDIKYLSLNFLTTILQYAQDYFMTRVSMTETRF